MLYALRGGCLALVPLVVLAHPAVAVAQNRVVKAGLSTASLASDTRSGGCRQGLVAGFSTFITAADAGGVQVEALLVQQGGREVLRRGDAVRLLYLELPVLLHLDLWQWQRGNSAVFAAVGPSVAVNLSTTYTDETGDSESIGADTARTGLGLTFGGGVELGPLVLDARYTLGFRPVFTAGDTRFRSRTLTATAGARF